jgi:hypothetical protein
MSCRFEAVHLDQQLVQRLLALFMAEGVPAAIPADRVELVDEDDAGLVTAGVAEQPAHARGANAGVHFDEVGAARGNKWHGGLASHRPREQRLAGARRTHEQDAARDPAANRFEPAGFLEEVDDFGHLVLRFIDAGDVLEGDRDLLEVNRTHALERRDPARHHPVEHESGNAEEEQAHPERGIAAGAGGLGFAHFQADAACGQVSHKGRIRGDVPLWRDSLEPRAVEPLEPQAVGADNDAGDTTGLHIAEELGEGNRGRARAGGAQREERRNRQHNDEQACRDPEQTGTWKLASEHRYPLRTRVAEATRSPKLVVKQ